MAGYEILTNTATKQTTKIVTDFTDSTGSLPVSSNGISIVWYDFNYYLNQTTNIKGRRILSFIDSSGRPYVLPDGPDAGTVIKRVIPLNTAFSLIGINVTASATHQLLTSATLIQVYIPQTILGNDTFSSLTLKLEMYGRVQDELYNTSASSYSKSEAFNLENTYALFGLGSGTAIGGGVLVQEIAFRGVA